VFLYNLDHQNGAFLMDELTGIRGKRKGKEEERAERERGK
jgi:hypothetical protein